MNKFGNWIEHLTFTATANAKMKIGSPFRIYIKFISWTQN